MNSLNIYIGSDTLKKCALLCYADECYSLDWLYELSDHFNHELSIIVSNHDPFEVYHGKINLSI